MSNHLRNLITENILVYIQERKIHELTEYR